VTNAGWSPEIRKKLHSPLGKCRQLDKVIFGHRLQVSPGLVPRGETADEHKRVKSIFPQYVRHPGARGFARSSTVQINVLVLGEILHLLFQVVGLNANGSEDPFRAFVIVPVAANVDDQNSIVLSRGNPRR